MHQQQPDDAEAMQDMARYARRVVGGWGSSSGVAHRSARTIRCWEQGRRCRRRSFAMRVLDKESAEC